MTFQFLPLLVVLGALAGPPAHADIYVDELMSAAVGRLAAPAASDEDQVDRIAAALAFRFGWTITGGQGYINGAIPYLLDEINAVRSVGGYCGATYYPPSDPLAWSWDLTVAARMHFEDMVTLGYWGHVSPTGRTSQDWADDSGWSGYWVYDNLARGSPSFSTTTIVDAWLKDGHCQWVRDQNITELGGYVGDHNGVRYWLYYGGVRD